jgi:hypothetical protein
MPVQTTTIQRTKPVRIPAELLTGVDGMKTRERRTSVLLEEGLKFLTEVRGLTVRKASNQSKVWLYAAKTGKGAREFHVLIKSAASRRLGVAQDINGTFSTLNQADEVLVVAFDTYPMPRTLQIWSVSGRKLADEAKRFHKAADGRGTHAGSRTIPFEINPSKWGLDADTTPFTSYAQLVYEAPVVAVKSSKDGGEEQADTSGISSANLGKLFVSGAQRQEPTTAEAPAEQAQSSSPEAATDSTTQTSEAPAPQPEETSGAQWSGEDPAAESVADAPAYEPVVDAPPAPYEPATVEALDTQQFSGLRRTIYEAKLSLAEKLGVSPGAVNITVVF